LRANDPPLSQLISEATQSYQRGRELFEHRLVTEALACFDAAQRMGFDICQCAASRWHCWMLVGEFDRAWQESDCIAAIGGPDVHRFWNGQPWAGQRVMLRCLHGLGDTIQFIRFAPLLRRDCSRLIVQTHPQLRTLVRGVAGVDDSRTWGPDYTERRSEWDTQMEVNELPRAFRTSLATLPCEVPYIRVPQERVAWAARLLPERAGMRIGLCWNSGPWDPARSISIDELAPLFAMRQHQFFSLQKNADLAKFPRQCLLDLEQYASDVRDTAALILHLDLVITVDTMTAHLAGALGRPVWILLRHASDWRWMLDRRDTPWYPTARLFRQQRPGHWTLVIAEVMLALGSESR
jgi:hypothetical protein